MPARKAKVTKDKPSGDVKEVKKSLQEKMKKTKSKGQKSSSKVDTLCPIGHKATIFKEGNEVWECMLNQTNIQNNNNKYFLLQLLVDESTGQYSTWFRWGRVGYNGQNDLKQWGGNLENAKNHLMKKFSDKTKNQWEDRKKFVKVPGKYELVDIQVATNDEDDEDEVDEGPAPKKKKIGDLVIMESELDKKVQDLIEMICDKKLMEETLKALKFDVDKAPLGKLTAEQIKSGYKALSKIADLINNQGKGSKMSLSEVCNEFYTRIPHYFGMRRPDLIDSIETVKEKIELLDVLNDIQMGIKAVEPVKEEVEVRNPLDTQYKRLDVHLDPLDHGHDEFKLLEKYIKSTHGSTHTSYKMKVQDIFVCEKSSFKFKDKGNRMLLFHGSRVSNYAGILSQGLRIAPPEAPVTGYMFGKGCYFADMSSKSANYCFPSKSQPEGLLLLCEVSLGKQNELLNAKYDADKLPKGKHSVKGVGKNCPTSDNYTKLSDGTIIPMGKLAAVFLFFCLLLFCAMRSIVCSILLGPGSKKDIPGAALLYNEYIVYDTEQIRLRYLAKIHFEF